MTSVEEALEVLGKAKADRNKNQDLELGDDFFEHSSTASAHLPLDFKNASFCRKTSQTQKSKSLEEEFLLEMSWNSGLSQCEDISSCQIPQSHNFTRSFDSKPREENISSLMNRRRGGTRIIVAVRVRPLFEYNAEKSLYTNGKKAVGVNKQNIIIWQQGQIPLEASRRKSRALKLTPEKYKRKSFDFDYVFDQGTSQSEVYRAIALPLLKSVMKGINACLLCYGQTGAGKTYTSFGKEYGDNSFHDELLSRSYLNEHPRLKATYDQSKPSNNAIDLGVIPRSIHGLFDELKRKASSMRSSNSENLLEYSIEITYYQIYLDSHIQDLLEPENENIQIRRGEKHDYVEGLSVHSVGNVVEVLALLERGAQNKVVANTSMNKTSSRSHCIFTVEVIQKISRKVEGLSPDMVSSNESFEYNDDLKVSHVLKSKFTFVDLAGSERTCKTQPVGLQLEEAKAINKSLSALGNVIAALGDNEANDLSGLFPETSVNSSSMTSNKQNTTANFVPWRDSKLTRVLQESLDGNAHIALLVNVSPCANYVRETVNSLLFGKRAMAVKIKPKINLEIDYQMLAVNLYSKLRQTQVFIKEMGIKHANETKTLEEKLVKVSDNNLETKATVSKYESIIQDLENQLKTKSRYASKLEEIKSLLEEALLDQLGVDSKGSFNKTGNNSTTEAILELYNNRKQKEEKEEGHSETHDNEILKEKELQIENLKKELQLVRDKFQSEHLLISAERQGIEEKLRNELENSSSEIQRLRSLLDESSFSLSTKSNLLIKETEKCQKAEEHLFKTEEENQEMLREKSELKQQNKLLSAAKEECIKNLEQVRATKVELESQLEIYTKQNLELQNKTENLEMYLEEMEKQKSEIKAKTSEVENLRLELESNAVHIKNLEEKLQVSISTNEANVVYLEQRDSEIGVLNKQLESQIAANRSLESNLKEKATALRIQIQEYECTKNKNKKLLAERELLQKAHDQIHLHLEQTENKISEMQYMRKYEKALYTELFPQTRQVDRTSPNQKVISSDVLEEKSRKLGNQDIFHRISRKPTTDFTREFPLCKNMESSPGVKLAVKRSREALLQATSALNLCSSDE